MHVCSDHSVHVPSSKTDLPTVPSPSSGSLLYIILGGSPPSCLFHTSLHINYIRYIRQASSFYILNNFDSLVRSHSIHFLLLSTFGFFFFSRIAHIEQYLELISNCSRSHSVVLLPASNQFLSLNFKNLF
ncbi:hypothetical protein L873DRAFT_1115258 [Choiromyces venosus 120613-1]|uniref:Uncharacterized protein n=1 Tax=Choiromyces venosus 120613-1 TaxID=1336337 RepID=A0A3N4JH45_9PEZI|nr:hypothetical protein L873DRAFT_1115258 [Choiromyces venosus 120613-1]